MTKERPAWRGDENDFLILLLFLCMHDLVLQWENAHTVSTWLEWVSEASGKQSRLGQQSLFLVFKFILLKKKIVALLHGMWDLSLPTGDQTHTTPALDAWNLNHSFYFLVKVLNENMVRVETLTDMWQTCLKSGKSPGEKVLQPWALNEAKDLFRWVIIF